MKKFTYGAGDTSITCATGLKIIYHYDISPPSVTAVPVDFAAVAGGTITITTTNPGGACYLFVTAYGI